MPRCSECGSRSVGFASCPSCGQGMEPLADVRDTEPPPLAPREKPRRGRRTTVAAAAAALVAGAAVIVLWSPESTEALDPGDVLSSEAEQTSSPAATEPEPTIKPARRCWDGSRVEGADRCRPPAGERGLAAVSPTFVEARREGRCRPSPDDHTAGGYLCEIDGAELHFAWFDTLADQDRHFAGIYPKCRRDGYLRSCKGPNRVAKRYADQRFLFEVTATRADRAALDQVRLLDSDVVLRGAARD